MSNDLHTVLAIIFQLSLFLFSCSKRNPFVIIGASFFYKPDGLPETQPTMSKHWLVNKTADGIILSLDKLKSMK